VLFARTLAETSVTYSVSWTVFWISSYAWKLKILI